MTEKDKLRIYRGLAVVGLLVAIVLAFALPYELREPDSWAYRYAVENFADGKLIIDDALHQQQVREAQEQGGWLAQYVQIDNDKWVLEKAPGYVFFVVPFEWLGIPRAANVVLAIGLAFVTYLVMRRLAGEAAACLASLLMFYTPVSLIMFHRSYMAMFGASAFLAMGGGLYIYYLLRQRDSPDKRKDWWILAIAGLLLGWSVVARYSNLVVVGVFALHFAATRLPMLLHDGRALVLRDGLALGAGLAASLSVLLAYNTYLFGSPLDYSYNYSPFNINFAWDFIGETAPNGESIPLQIIEGNLRGMPVPLLLGFPVLVIALPALLYVLARKLGPTLGRLGASAVERIGGAWRELPLSIVLVLLGWFVAVYGFYLFYEWTSKGLAESGHFIIVDRFYLPGLFPLVVLAALLLARMPAKFTVAALVVYMTMGSLLFAQAVNGGSAFGQPKAVRVGGPGIPNQPFFAPGDVRASAPGETTPGGPAQPPSVPGDVKPPAPGETTPGSPAQPKELPQELIDRVRQEVAARPTDETNLGMRFDVMLMWVRDLKQEGYDVDRALPSEAADEIMAAMKRGDVERASRLVDEAYRRLENLAEG